MPCHTCVLVSSDMIYNQVMTSNDCLLDYLARKVFIVVFLIGTSLTHRYIEIFTFLCSKEKGFQVKREVTHTDLLHNINYEKYEGVDFYAQ